MITIIKTDISMTAKEQADFIKRHDKTIILGLLKEYPNLKIESIDSYLTFDEAANLKIESIDSYLTD